MIPEFSNNSRSLVKRNVGYFFIWGDIYRVFFGVHALLVGSMDVETHLQTYLLVFMPVMEWVSSLSPLTAGLVTFVLGLPAAPVYFGGFAVSTSIGVWLVRTSGASRETSE